MTQPDQPITRPVTITDFNTPELPRTAQETLKNIIGTCLVDQGTYLRWLSEGEIIDPQLQPTYDWCKEQHEYWKNREIPNLPDDFLLLLINLLANMGGAQRQLIGEVNELIDVRALANTVSGFSDKSASH